MKISIDERRIPFQGCSNFRDTGGYRTPEGQRVRWGRLFRSDTIHGMTARDADRARRELGIVTVIDMRTAGEKARCGTGLLALPPVRYYHLSLLKWQGRAAEWQHWCPSLDMSECYLTMLEEAGETIARVVKLLTKPEAYPAVFYCMAGKDRTGVTAAVILSLLGVSEEEIVYDYALTERYLNPARPGTGSSCTSPGQDVPGALLKAAPETMKAFLAKVGAKYGSTLGFFRVHGITEDHILRLKENLLAPALSGVAVAREATLPVPCRPRLLPWR